MRKNFFIIFLLTAITLFAQSNEKINIPGFGELPVTRQGKTLMVDFGEKGAIGFDGTINPLNLKATVTVDELKNFPGYNFFSTFPIENVSLAVSLSGLEIGGEMERLSINGFTQMLRNGFKLKVPDVFPNSVFVDDGEFTFNPTGGFSFNGVVHISNLLNFSLEFNADLTEGFLLDFNLQSNIKEAVIHELNKNKVLAKIAKPLSKSLEIRNVEIFLKAGTDGELAGKTHLDIIALNSRIPIPDLNVSFDLNHIVKNIANNIANKYGGQITAIAKNVGNSAKVAGKKIGQGARFAQKMVKLGISNAKHLHPKGILHPVNKHICREQCIPNRANELIGKVLPPSLQAIQSFYDNIIDDIVRLEGNSYEDTKELREAMFLNDWNNLNSKIEEDWKHIWEDKFYYGLFIRQSAATEGGKIYRAIITKRKQEYINLRDRLYHTLIDARIVDNHPFKRISNKLNRGYLNIENGPVEVNKIGGGAHSSMWIIEPIKGTNAVRIKNRWKGTYLHIENGPVEAANIGAGAWSSMWVIEPVQGSNFVRIKNRWKNTYLNFQNNKLQCTDIQPDWKSAMWQLEENGDAAYGAKQWNTNGTLSWGCGNVIAKSDNDKFTLVFQDDGNLVLYQYTILPLWATNTTGKGADNFRFQKDGNLVILKGNQVIWASNSYNKNGETLFLQNDGNLVIHAPGSRVIWAIR